MTASPTQCAAQSELLESLQLLQFDSIYYNTAIWMSAIDTPSI